MNERDEEIIRRYNIGQSAREVGIAVGVTKNTVIGVIKRARPYGDITREPMECRVEQGKLAALVRWGFRRSRMRQNQMRRQG